MASANTPQSSLAVILVRGEVGLSHPIKSALEQLRLTRKNMCVLYNDTPSIRGMIKKVKDFVTWGELSGQAFKELIDHRGVKFQGREQDSKGLYSYKVLSVDGKKYKPYFCLNPPRKGFGRKGIKVAFSTGGALGYRGDKINDLIKRML